MTDKTTGELIDKFVKEFDGVVMIGVTKDSNWSWQTVKGEVVLPVVIGCMEMMKHAVFERYYPTKNEYQPRTIATAPPPVESEDKTEVRGD